MCVASQRENVKQHGNPKEGRRRQPSPVTNPYRENPKPKQHGSEGMSAFVRDDQNLLEYEQQYEISE